MSAVAPRTDKMTAYAPPPLVRLPAALLAAGPGGPGELWVRLFVAGRPVELTLALSAGDRVALALAFAAVPERPTARVRRADTIRTPPNAAA